MITHYDTVHQAQMQFDGSFDEYLEELDKRQPRDIDAEYRYLTDRYMNELDEQYMYHLTTTNAGHRFDGDLTEEQMQENYGHVFASQQVKIHKEPTQIIPSQSRPLPVGSYVTSSGLVVTLKAKKLSIKTASIYKNSNIRSIGQFTLVLRKAA